MGVPHTELIILHHSEEIGRYTLKPGVYSIGRASANSIRVDVDGVSRQHAQICVGEEGQLSVQDLGSSNGTSVDEQPVSSTESHGLRANQTITLGSAVSLLIQQQASSAGSDVSLAEALSSGLPAEFVNPERYAIGEQIAKGGMGAILEARESAARRTVAMKVILGEAEGSPRHRMRFIEEAQITAQLEHPNIVPVHDVGIDAEGRIFYTMKLVKGITLRKVLQLLKKGTPGTLQKYPLTHLLTVFQKVCDALAFAHSKGVIHRDLKPENIMIGSFGEVLVMDWGLAKLIGCKGADPRETMYEVASARFDEGESHATMDGSVMGTPSYMAPEQARGELEALDQRTDLFALGVILYEMLSLERPFIGGSSQEVIAVILSGKPPRAPSAYGRKGSHARPLPHLAGGEVPPALSAVAMRAIAFDPRQRYQHTKDLQADLGAYQNGFATTAEKAGTWTQARLFLRRNKVAALGAVAVLLTGLAFGTKAVMEGRRANLALGELKGTAPALVQLAENQARFQRFDEALRSANAAIALDPAYGGGYWQRAWILLALERFAEAADAIHLAAKKDAKHADWESVLPLTLSLAAAPQEHLYEGGRGAGLFNYFETMGASGQMIALSTKLKLASSDRMKLVRARLIDWLGPEAAKLPQMESNGEITLNLSNFGLKDLEPLRGLPLNSFAAQWNTFTSLSPLKGMPLTGALDVYGSPVADLNDLAGMPLQKLSISNTRVRDLSPLKGMRLQTLHCSGNPIRDFTVLRGMPLKTLDIAGAEAPDLSFLSDSPLEVLVAYHCGIVNVSALEGKPLTRLNLSANRVAEFAPLRHSPIEELDISGNPVQDYSALLDIASLRRLRIGHSGQPPDGLRAHRGIESMAYDQEAFRPVAQFWQEYDASKAEGKK